MLKFVSKALLSVVMDKSARDKLEAARKGKDENAEKPDAAAPAAATAARALPGKPVLAPSPKTLKRAPREMTPERRALIQEALDIQRSKDHIFDNLSDDAKAKLLIAAVKAMGIPPDEFEKGLTRPPPSKPPGKTTATGKKPRGLR